VVPNHIIAAEILNAEIHNNIISNISASSASPERNSSSSSSNSGSSSTVLGRDNVGGATASSAGIDSNHRENGSAPATTTLDPAFLTLPSEPAQKRSGTAHSGEGQSLDSLLSQDGDADNTAALQTNNKTKEDPLANTAERGGERTNKSTNNKSVETDMSLPALSVSSSASKDEQGVEKSSDVEKSVDPAEPISDLNQLRQSVTQTYAPLTEASVKHIGYERRGIGCNIKRR
jgi:hypothetical protein